MTLGHSTKAEFQKMISKINPVERFDRNLYCVGNEEPCRACLLKRMTKAQITELHEREIELKRVLGGFEIARHYKIQFHFIYTDREYVLVIEEINKQRPRRVEPRPCDKCNRNYQVCKDYKGGDCLSAYTDLEYRHAWDWNIFHNSSKELFMKESSSKRLLDQVDNN